MLLILDGFIVKDVITIIGSLVCQKDWNMEEYLGTTAEGQGIKKVEFKVGAGIIPSVEISSGVKARRGELHVNGNVDVPDVHFDDLEKLVVPVHVSDGANINLKRPLGFLKEILFSMCAMGEMEKIWKEN